MNLKILLKHKRILSVGLLVVAAAGFLIYHKITGNQETTKYTTATAEKGTLVVSVSGSGQVNVSNQIDIKPKVSGELISLYVAKDQVVKKGQLLAVLDSTSAEKTVRDAQNTLDDAEYSLAQAQKDYKDIETEANRTLTSAYEDGYDAVSSTFFKLSGYMNDLKDTLGTEKSAQEYITGYELILGKNSSFTQKLIEDCDAADDAFDKDFAFFRTVSREDASSTIYQLLVSTLETTKTISQAIDSARHMFDAIALYDYTDLRAVATQIDTMQPKIQSDVSVVYANISSLQTIEDTIDNTNEDTPGKIEDAQRAIQGAENTVVKKQEALADAKDELVKYSVYAPFTGVIATLGDAQKGDTVSSNTVLATLITKEKIAEITLNEVDAAKVKIGQKATITFDALEDLTVTGQVIEIDTLGTTNQGVVDYGAQISLETTDEAIKPGMTLSAEIITDAKQDVVMVPTTAIKKQNDAYYVKMAADLASVFVQLGLANDTMTEITSGLQEGDIVVTQTSSASSKSSSSSSQTSGQPSTSQIQMRQMEQIMR